MATEKPKPEASELSVQQLRDFLERLPDAFERFRQSLPIIRPRLRSAAPPGDIREFVIIAEDLARDERDHIAAFGMALMDWIEAGAPYSLDKFLGLRGRGGPSLRYKYILEERNRALRRLRREHWPELSPSEAAAAMIESFNRYSTRQWTRDKRSDTRGGPPARPRR